MNLKCIFEELCKGNIGILTFETKKYISDMAMSMYSNENTANFAEDLKYLIMICNVLYNRTSMEVLPVEDGVYDILLERYKSIDPNFQVGSAVVDFQFKEQSMEEKKGIVNPIHFVDNSVYEKDEQRLYFRNEIQKFNNLYPYVYGYQTASDTRVNKRTHDTEHNHPDLIGTLDKCKFVLDVDAMAKDAYNDDRVKILERDWFVKHINQGIITPDQELDIMIELKYDGISVEADCSTEIESARTRGDTGIGKASDLTPMLKGYKFPCISEEQSEAIGTVGVKFEAIMTKSDLYKFNIARNTTYANCRTAIIGLFGASDANLYRDYITLVPLAVDRSQVPFIETREEEVVFLNKLFRTKNCALRHVEIHGNYQVCLFLIKKFLEEAYVARNYLDFMFDGIVVSYLDNEIRAKLGRENHINKYQMAVKFDAESKLTTFLGYTYEVGQNGNITPMIHYAPVEFNGTIHPKSTGSSYNRFIELGLHCGDIIKVTYTNDVMPYVESIDCEANRINAEHSALCEFTKLCPVCGSPVQISDTGKTAYCPNIDCNGRKLARMTNMLQKLNLKGFAESTISQLNVYSLKELCEYDEERMARIIGPGNASNLVLSIRSLMANPIEDFRIIGSLGFTNVAAKTWKIIFSKFNLKEFDNLIKTDPYGIGMTLKSLSGIGDSTIATILTEYRYFEEDIKYIMLKFNIIDSMNIKYGKQIRFTGCRDKALEDKLKALGHDADGNAGVTKKTDILIIPYEGFSSTKINKVSDDCIVVTLSEFNQNPEKYL